jgi:hypothetical protein
MTDSFWFQLDFWWAIGNVFFTYLVVMAWASLNLGETQRDNILDLELKEQTEDAEILRSLNAANERIINGLTENLKQSTKQSAKFQANAMVWKDVAKRNGRLAAKLQTRIKFLKLRHRAVHAELKKWIDHKYERRLLSTDDGYDAVQLRGAAELLAEQGGKFKGLMVRSSSQKAKLLIEKLKEACGPHADMWVYRPALQEFQFFNGATLKIRALTKKDAHMFYGHAFTYIAQDKEPAFSEMHLTKMLTRGAALLDVECDQIVRRRACEVPMIPTSGGPELGQC